MLACGVRNYNEGNLDINVQQEDMVEADVTPRRLKIYKCMKIRDILFTALKSVRIKGNLVVSVIKN